jgi:2-polyprenyl-3-methyl-5-hydroxy-6-metoxy-1,4-benzoquinol methylase
VSLGINSTCPACFGDDNLCIERDSQRYRCSLCAHIWVKWGTNVNERLNYYSNLRGRNLTTGHDYERKMVDRLGDLAALLRDNMRILEVGCAEGGLGRHVKEIAHVEYVGIELSEDAVSATSYLDRVSRVPAKKLHDEPYDLILSFHVLEHTSDIYNEVKCWRRLLKSSGCLVVEVPHEAGHPLLSQDLNPEHLHQFTSASLSVLLQRAGYSIKRLSTGHFESAPYSDSLRVLAYPRMDAEERKRHLIARFRSVFPGQFVAYGIGGDFNNYIAPLLPELQIAALVDSNASRYEEHIGGFQVEEFNIEKYSDLPILVTSHRYKTDIADMLQKQGVSPQRIYGLDSIFG